MRWFRVVAVAGLVSGCTGSSTGVGSTGGVTGQRMGASSAGSASSVGASSGTTGAIASSGSVSGSSGSGSAGSTSGFGTASGTSGATASGSSTGAPVGAHFAPCPAGFGFVQGDCVASQCTQATEGVPCGLRDSGVGFCALGSCNATNLAADSDNCGALGLRCPADTACSGGRCLTPGQRLSACDAGACLAGQVCFPTLGCLYDTQCSDAPVSAPCGSPSGPDGITNECCGGSCASLASDPNNCGGCGYVCPAGTGCVPRPGLAEPGLKTTVPVAECVPTTCLPTSLAEAPCALADAGAPACCSGACTDESADPDNCGACGAACPPSVACLDGRCATGCHLDSDCATGEACARGRCYALTCSDGGETACAVSVSTGQLSLGLCCASGCALTASDPENCGGCGVSCGTGTCLAGVCQGFPPPTSCAALGNGSPCFVGPRQGSCCGGACTFDDDANCGICGFGCPSGSDCTHTGGGAACLSDAGVAASCQSASQCPAHEVCASVQTGLGGACLSETCTVHDDTKPCGQLDGGVGTCCAAACAVLASDSRNCGACGAVCPTGSSCSSGICLQTDGGQVAHCAPSSCPSGTDCLGGNTCRTGSCKGVEDGDACAFGFNLAGVCCGGVCVDALSQGNCNGCGLVCKTECLPEGEGAFCFSSSTTAACPAGCGAGQTCFQGRCAPLSCEAVGQFCPTTRATPGICCAGGAGLTCADIENDAANCGGCALQCASGQFCRHGVCSGLAAPCNSLQSVGAFCDLDGGLGFVCCPEVGCTNVEVDPGNCGGCGTVCAGGRSCQNGSCL